MVELIFWASFGFLFYVYLGYPLLLWLRRRMAGRPVQKAAIEPSVSLIIAAHDERDNIESKIRNCLSLDYPREKLQVVLSLDAPTDGTEDVVWRYAGRCVDVVYYSPHRGKAAAINAAVRAAEGDILLFADARQRIDTRAIRALVPNFADPEVGAVSGELVMVDAGGNEANDGVGLYWRYEKALRAMESDIHSTLGATGALYAIRRGLFEPLPIGTVLDDVAVPMRAALSGYRVTFESAARAYDPLSTGPEVEYGRKVRTLMGNFQLLAFMPELLNPRANPVFWQFVSHKVSRLAAPYVLMALFVSNVLLVERSFYFGLFALQTMFYVLAWVGALLSNRPTVTSSRPSAEPQSLRTRRRPVSAPQRTNPLVGAGTREAA